VNAHEPPIGSEVVDRHEQRWEHVEGATGNHYWVRSDIDDGDPESWIRVNEFGPLRLAWIVGDLQTGGVREELRPMVSVAPEDFFLQA
jgi:hypothetical protein